MDENCSNMPMDERQSLIRDLCSPCQGLRALPRSHLSGRREAGEQHGILRRIVSAIWEARRRRAEREIAGFIARRGGRITDEVEREIGRRQLTSNWSARP
jgi:hypothetical protein